MRITVGLLIGLFFSPAFAQQGADTFIGLRLNEALTIRECAKEEYTPDSGACYRRNLIYGPYGSRPVLPKGPLGNEKVDIHFASAEEPEIVLGSIEATMFQGKLLTVQVVTNGIATQERDLAQLTEKFGRPASLERPKYQNDYGATYEGIAASWELPSGTVVGFESMRKLGNNADKSAGVISVISRKARDMVEQNALKQPKRTGL